jgi:hypothetical protein
MLIMPMLHSEEGLPGLSEEEYLEHYGKWLISGSKGYIESLARLIDPLVEGGQIDSAKYSKKEPRTDPFPDKRDYVMCVYSDDRERDRVKRLLESLGVERMTWKYDRQTIEDWEPGGKLFEESKRRLEE